MADVEPAVTPLVAPAHVRETGATTVKEEFSRFFREERDSVIAMLLSMNATVDEAQDAMQSGMQDVLGRWTKIDHPRAYVRTAARSHFYRGKRGGRRVTVTGDLGNLGSDVDHSTEGSVWEDEEWVMTLIHGLPPRQAEAMALAVDQFKPSEMAVILGRTEGAVRQSLLQARRRLRECLEPEMRRDIAPSQVREGGRRS